MLWKPMYAPPCFNILEFCAFASPFKGMKPYRYRWSLVITLVHTHCSRLSPPRVNTTQKLAFVTSMLYKVTHTAGPSGGTKEQVWSLFRILVHVGGIRISTFGVVIFNLHILSSICISSSFIAFSYFLLLCSHICFFFWLCLMACGILAPRLGIEPASQQWKLGVLTTGPPGNSKVSLFFLT